MNKKRSLTDVTPLTISNAILPFSSFAAEKYLCPSITLDSILSKVGELRMRTSVVGSAPDGSERYRHVSSPNSEDRKDQSSENISHYHSSVLDYLYCSDEMYGSNIFMMHAQLIISLGSYGDITLTLVMMKQETYYFSEVLHCNDEEESSLKSYSSAKGVDM
jgi:hypothetical protein